MTQDIFLVRLRRRRERAGLSLADIALRTRIRVDALEAFERGDLSLWPRGLYARAWMRQYAECIGIEPEDTVEEFCRLFAVADRRAQATMEALAGILGVPPLTLDDQTPRQGRRASDVLRVPRRPTLRERIDQLLDHVRALGRLRERRSRLFLRRPSRRPSA